MIKFKTQREYIRKVVLDLSKIQHPSEILSFFRDNGITEYVYEIKFAGQILKYGYSSSSLEGERLYRQVANIPEGWDISLPRSPSGKDFSCVCDDYYHKWCIQVDKNKTEVVVYDMTKYLFEFSDHIREIKRFEAELIAAYEDLHGNRPIGNIKSESYSLTISEIPQSRLEEIFEF